MSIGIGVAQRRPQGLETSNDSSYATDFHLRLAGVTYGGGKRIDATPTENCALILVFSAHYFFGPFRDLTKKSKNCVFFGLNSQIDSQFAVFLFTRIIAFAIMQCPTRFDSQVSHLHLDNSIRFMIRISFIRTHP